jgi:hypothetical protein
MRPFWWPPQAAGPVPPTGFEAGCPQVEPSTVAWATALAAPVVTRAGPVLRVVTMAVACW